MPFGSVDRLCVFRDDSNGHLTATEAAGTRNVLVPPGEYFVEVSVPAAPTGSSPVLTVTFKEASDGSTWATMATAPSIAPSTTAASVNTGYLKVTKQPNSGVTANVTAISTVTGTTPDWGNVFIALYPINRGHSGFNGLP